GDCGSNSGRGWGVATGWVNGRLMLCWPGLVPGEPDGLGRIGFGAPGEISDQLNEVHHGSSLRLLPQLLRRIARGLKRGQASNRGTNVAPVSDHDEPTLAIQKSACAFPRTQSCISRP